MLFKLSYEFGEGNYLELKAGKTDLDGDVSYIGVTKADFNANPYQRYAGTRHDNMDSDQTRYYLRYLKEISDTTKLTAAIFSNEFNRDWYKISKVDGNSVGEGVLGDANNVAILKGDADGTIVYKHNDRTYETQGIQANLDFELGSHALDLGFRYTNDDYTYNPSQERDFQVQNLNWLECLGFHKFCHCVCTRLFHQRHLSESLHCWHHQAHPPQQSYHQLY
jgi:Fe(3+) dicitrate transport protein